MIERKEKKSYLFLHFDVRDGLILVHLSVYYLSNSVVGILGS